MLLYCVGLAPSSLKEYWVIDWINKESLETSLFLIIGVVWLAAAVRGLFLVCCFEKRQTAERTHISVVVVLLLLRSDDVLDQCITEKTSFFLPSPILTCDQLKQPLFIYNKFQGYYWIMLHNTAPKSEAHNAAAVVNLCSRLQQLIYWLLHAFWSSLIIWNQEVASAREY